MQSNPPPRRTGEIDKGFIDSLVESVYSIWFNADKLIETQESELVSTTDATVTTLNLIPLADEHTYHIRTIVIGVKATGSSRASYEVTGTFYRTGAGSATQEGSTTVVHSAEDVAGWDATYDVSGNDVRVRVTGAAATSITWRSSSKVMSLSN